MTWRRSYPDPLLRIEALDVTGDGTEEIVMMSNRGVHVLKHDEKEVEKLR